jgi:hypothetical protein
MRDKRRSEMTPMEESRFDVQFIGELAKGEDALAVRSRLGTLFKLSPKILDRLFSGEPIIIKRDIDRDTATQYQDAFRNAGAIAHVMASPGAAPSDTNLSLTQKGSAVEEIAALTPEAIGPTDLCLVIGDDWTLEDCAPVVVPAPFPDISHLDLVPKEPLALHPARGDEE